MPTCPNGHQSVSDDWCEVCGHRMAGAGAPTGAVPPPPPPPPPAYGYPGPGGPVPPPPAPGGYGGPGGFDAPGGYDGPGGPGGYDPNATAQAELCPQCRTPREHMAPFCEECRWNFLTNTATSYTPIAPHPQQGPPPALNLPPGFQSPPQPPQPQHPQQRPSHPDPYEYQGSRPSQVNRPAEPLGADPTHHQAPPQRPPLAPQPPQAPQAFHQAPPPPPVPQQPQQPMPPQPRADDDWMISPPSQPQPPAPPPPAPAPPTGPVPQGPPAQFRQPGPPAGWTATIGPDRDYFMAMMQRSGPEATGLNLPAYSPEQHIRLQGNQIGIGRRRHSTGESPDIDLSVPPEDPGVSHQHAVLVQQPDGSWAVVDQNSTNGTTINGSADPIQPYVPVQLQDGDRVHVGAWTTITVRYG
ncbi:FHA domain-containing protein [Streptomyces sp. NBC_01268]|uniref:FHA domain-containing protein n=1 Tax=Streptomyces sp. NBC_01268 TaxID=2903806 RepID=UPI002E326226|nr:FHA domain-containing protein [Streptomyces sp. NBC_01268]